MKRKPFTIQDLWDKYPNDDVCLHEVFISQYCDTLYCKKCSKPFKYYRIKKKKCYCCQYCGYMIYPLAGTIFERSYTPLKSWFYAIYLFATSSNGVSSKELQRHLGVTYKTAWRMAHQIRKLFNEEPKMKFYGIVESDETYIGGKKRKSLGSRQLPVVGIVQRGGKLVAKVTKNTRAKTLLPMIQKYVYKKSRIVTDEYKSYFRLKKIGYKNHDTIRHEDHRYVDGDIYTNTVEGFWSILKRSINGTYSHISPKHAQSYVNEFVYRYNLRNSTEHPFYTTMIKALRTLSEGGVSFEE